MSYVVFADFFLVFEWLPGAGVGDADAEDSTGLGLGAGWNQVGGSLILISQFSLKCA